MHNLLLAYTAFAVGVASPGPSVRAIMSTAVFAFAGVPMLLAGPGR